MRGMLASLGVALGLMFLGTSAAPASAYDAAHPGYRDARGVWHNRRVTGYRDARGVWHNADGSVPGARRAHTNNGKHRGWWRGRHNPHKKGH